MEQEDAVRRFEKPEHQNELLQKQVGSDMKFLQAGRREEKAENDSAFERLRADMEKNAKSLLLYMAALMGGGFAFLSVIIAFK